MVYNPFTPPEWVKDVQSVVEWIDNPCHAPWPVYVGLAIPALGDATLQLLDFGLGDVIRGALRPKQLRSLGKMRGFGPRGRRGGGIPEIGNMLGKMIPFTESFRGRQIGMGREFLWLVDGAVQRVLWYSLIADIGKNFVINFASAIHESQTCTKQQQGYAHSESVEDFFYFSVANAWIGITTANKIHEHNGAKAHNAACWNSGKPFSCVVTAAVNKLGDLGIFELSTGDQGSGSITLRSAQFNPTTGKHEMVWKVDSPGDFQTFAYRTNGGTFRGQITVHTFGH